MGTGTYLLVVGVIFAVMLGGILVDRLYARFARRHPELGPFRDRDSGCGSCAEKQTCEDRRTCGS